MFCNVIIVFFHFDVNPFFVMIKSYFIDNNIVFCLIILLLQSNHVIVGLAMLVCNNLVFLYRYNVCLL